MGGLRLPARMKRKKKAMAVMLLLFSTLSLSLLPLSSSISTIPSLLHRRFPSFLSSPSPSPTPQDLASSLLSLLGDARRASSLDPSLVNQLLPCLRFLVPPAPPLFYLPPNPSPPQRKQQQKQQQHYSRLLRTASLSPALVGSDIPTAQWSGVHRGIQQLIRSPPSPVAALARRTVEWGGDPKIVLEALDAFHYSVPDVEGANEQKCQLTKYPYGRRFKNKELNKYMAFLFEAIFTLAPFVGLNVSLNRFDLFHGHLFLATDTGRLGVLFHAREYPAFNKESFPLNLGYCQVGSHVPYDESINLRNILWLAPMPDCCDSKCSEKWLAPGALLILDAHPDGIIYQDLVPEYVDIVRTIYEDDFGTVVADVNYLNLTREQPENRIFIC